MRIVRIDHLNITAPAAIIDACRDFYVRVLGLVDGARPPFRRVGAWLYAGDHPLVHLTVDPEPRPEVSWPDHIAFACEDFDGAIERLERNGIAFRVTEVPATKQTQIFVVDPAGVQLELNFGVRGA